MPDFEKDDFKFPDEQEVAQQETQEDDEKGFEIEIEDDAPEADRGREPMPKPLVEELEKDELDQYSDGVKERLKQMRKVWHDERRAKETAYREQQEAINLAQKLMEENKRIKATLDTGGKEYAQMLTSSANMELEMAKRAYKEAYDSGDADMVVDAQQRLQQANLRVMQAENFRPPALQQENFDIQRQQEQVQKPRQLSPKLLAWQDRNPWYGQDDEMTAAALGLDQKLRRSGEVEVGSDEYYAILDKTIRKRFPENFETPESKDKAEPRSKPKTVVAPAVRSTSSNKITLKQSQVNLAKKLGLTPEQYALELRKLEARNG